MIDPRALTLEQLRTLVAIAEVGSFSRAGRRLGRVQSAVSHTVARLEDELGLLLFDRRARTPRLTEAGEAVVGAARETLAAVDELVRLAGSLASGLEAEVSIVFDAIFPAEGLAELARCFAREFPQVGLRIGTETLGAVSLAVHRGTYRLGVCGPAAPLPDGVEAAHVGTVRMVPVAAPDHPLAHSPAPIGLRTLRRHTQIVLSERGRDVEEVDDVAVLSARTWRVVSLPTKHVLLRQGLGWGNLPEHLAAPDVAEGRLVPLTLRAWGRDEHLLNLRVVHRVDEPLGPAAEWVMGLLPELCLAGAGLA